MTLKERAAYDMMRSRAMEGIVAIREAERDHRYAPTEKGFIALYKSGKVAIHTIGNYDKDVIAVAPVMLYVSPEALIAAWGETYGEELYQEEDPRA